MYGVIKGTGSAVPVNRITNDDLAKTLDTNDTWIRERTGIGCRHVISGDEKTDTLAAEACRNALQMAGMKAEEIELILLATTSPNRILPSISCSVQNLIGAKNAACIDMNAACSGFVFAYQTAQAYMQCGIYKKILVIGADTISSLVDWKDRSSCILFGDAAGAVVLEAADAKEEVVPYFGVMHSDGVGGWSMQMESRNQNPIPEIEKTYIQMNGKEIFKFAVTRVPQVIGEALKKAGKSVEEVDLFLLHQANGRMIEAIARRMKQPMEKFPLNVEEYANSSSGTIPLLMDQLNRAGRLKQGDKIVLCGYGAGLSWGAVYMEWQKNNPV